jgi:hypothetical protein
MRMGLYNGKAWLGKGGMVWFSEALLGIGGGLAFIYDPGVHEPEIKEERTGYNSSAAKANTSCKQ